MRILHIIDTLGRGGAETLLVNVVNSLNQDFDNILLYFSAPHHLKAEITGAKVICLEIPFSVKNILRLKKEVQKVIEENRVSVVHSHSYWSNFIARLAYTEHVRFVQSYHNAIYDTLWDKKSTKLLAFLDKISYKKEIKLVAVSAYVKSILVEKLRYKNIEVLKNFSDDRHISVSERTPYRKGELLKVISVGNIKKEKNYDLLIEAFNKELKHAPIELDVFGGGQALKNFRKKVKDQSISNLHFRGQTHQVSEELKKYDLFCMTSFSEACPLSPLEAMRLNMPILLSDIPAFREITEHSVMFFESGNANDFIKKIQQIIKGEQNISVDKERYGSVLSQYSKEDYLAKLKNIYEN